MSRDAWDPACWWSMVSGCHNGIALSATLCYDPLHQRISIGLTLGIDYPERLDVVVARGATVVAAAFTTRCLTLKSIPSSRASSHRRWARVAGTGRRESLLDRCLEVCPQPIEEFPYGRIWR